MRINCIILAACLLLIGCSRALVEKTWLSMGTFAAVSASGQNASRIGEAEDVVVAEFERLERLWSNYDPKSEISRLSSSSGSEVAVSEATCDLLLKSIAFSRATEGRFDATVGTLVDLWGIGNPEEFRIPAAEEIHGALDQCGWQNIQVSPKGNAATLTIKGMVFDSGGIAKGLAVDLAYAKLLERGHEDFMINLGGNMRCIGSGRDGRAWNVGVRNPFDRGNIVGILELTDGMAVATSGNYERFVEKDGKRYAHIIDPTTGRPVEGMAGVTVVSPTALEADALSTALFVAGVEKGRQMLKSFPQSSAIFIEDRQPLLLKVAGGMEDRLTLTADVVVEVLEP